MSINEITKFLNINNFNFAAGGVLHEESQANIFFNILKDINSVSPKMFELGSYESFYSIVFNKFFENKNVTNVCLEICKSCLDIGIQNSINNQCKNMNFEYASVGKTNLGIYNGATQFKDLEISDRNLTIKYLFDLYKINVLDILHVDVQGSEGSVLEEIQKEKLKINYFFINIHDDNITNNFYGYSIYDKCKQILDTFDVDYIYDNRIYGGYGDGLIVAKTKN